MGLPGWMMRPHRTDSGRSSRIDCQNCSI
jgi:hypothetical protein